MMRDEQESYEDVYLEVNQTYEGLQLDKRKAERIDRWFRWAGIGLVLTGLNLGLMGALTSEWSGLLGMMTPVIAGTVMWIRADDEMSEFWGEQIDIHAELLNRVAKMMDHTYVLEPKGWSRRSTIDHDVEVNYIGTP